MTFLPFLPSGWNMNLMPGALAATLDRELTLNHELTLGMAAKLEQGASEKPTSLNAETLFQLWT